MRRKKSPPFDPEIAELEHQREALQRDIRELQIEHDLLKAASDLIKKGSWRRSAELEQSGKDRADRRPENSSLATGVTDALRSGADFLLLSPCPYLSGG
jgi:hypothetical protein